MCLTPFIRKNSAKSDDTNCGSLSDTVCSGSPYATKSCRRTSTTLEVVVECIS